MTGAQRGALPPPPLAGSYATILADPPWHMLMWSDKGRDRCPDGPRGYYKTLLTPDIAALPVASWGARDCRLFLWTTDCHLPQALALGAAWGFRYSTIAFTWAKQTKTGRTWQFGGGKATRKGSELCLLFLRGRLHRRSASVRQLIIAPVRDHSRKPDETYGRIEQLVDGPYLEMFARQRWPGWDAWGDQVPDVATPPTESPRAALDLSGSPGAAGAPLFEGLTRHEK